jgi:hypothetical protein
VGKSKAICVPAEMLLYQMLLINKKGKRSAANEVKSENRLKKLTCPKGKERIVFFTKPYHDFFSLLLL